MNHNEHKNCFSIDAESDGLYGEVFAIAVAVTDSEGNLLDRFSEKCISPGVQDEWTQIHCLPYLENIPDCTSRIKLRQDFWSFYLKYRNNCIIVADVPYLVEAQLF